MSITISMLIGSHLSSRHLVQKSISTIVKNIGTSDYLLVIGVSKHINQNILNMVKRKSSTKIIIETEHTNSFAEFTNYVFSKYANNSKWFLVSHDDIELKTKNFLPTVENTLKPLRTDIGWISFTDDDYLNGHWAPSTRPGYHNDFIRRNAWNRKKVFQFHSLPEGWYGKKNKQNLIYDFPIAPVICHAPFSHFIMIESKKYTLCENWSEVSLLVDEDWGLESMKKGLSNIWAPNIIYTHCRKNGTRAAPIIKKKGREAGKCFFKKWGFIHFPLTIKTLQKIKQKYGKTNITWSFGKNSFDWDYVK